MFYAVFPPEINSGRMYAGPGSGSMRAAAAAWEGLASELQSTVSSYSSVIESLTSAAWAGPTSVAMAAAVAPYLTWMQHTGAQATEAAAGATAAATAYETAFAAHVPPTEVTANRSQLASLVATNLFGQNTPAIAATEIRYSEMWAQDALAMESYAASSSAAARVTPFTAAPQITSVGGLVGQAAAATRATATAAGGVGSLLSSAANPLAEGNPLLAVLANLGTDYTATIGGLLNTLFGGGAATLYTNLYNAAKVPLGFTTGFNDIGLLINFPVSQWLKFSPPIPYGALPKDALGAGLAATGFGRGTLYDTVSAGMGNAGTLVGKLSVPASWATATPAIRTVAAALSAAGPEAVPAAAVGQGGLLSSVALAGMLGSALGAGAPSALSGITPIKDLRGQNSPESLKRLVARISEKPESVHHHNVDEGGLDALLETLSRKPGIHAVHLRKRDTPQIVPSDTQSGSCTRTFGEDAV
ncbi:PPE family protein [Mycobacterium sp.]|uniref:PPE family protein n=1 Tax=Mycobacterium sp. TaxID=1785 RepID=UPI0025FE3D0A|nr:PPE family protein [Mycobacterium sp.]MBW0011611.1 PPE family protein [Mycobacterium sp.]